MNNKNTILVTGAHRSGSTWVGKMLSLDKSVGYAHEPFVLVHPNSPIKDWFFYVHDQLPEERMKSIHSYMGRFYTPTFSRLLSDIFQVETIREIGRLIRDYLRHKKNQLFCKHLIIKDPIAILSTEWVQKTYGTKVVVVVRHPAAFVGSLTMGDGRHDFNHFLRQPILMKKLLQPYKEQIEEFARVEKTVVEQGALLWNILYGTIVELRKNNPDWIFVTHDALSLEPMEAFEKLYQQLGLDFNSAVKEKLKSFTKANDNQVQIKRDSKKNLETWKKRLTETEISFVKKETEVVWQNFYSEKDW